MSNSRSASPVEPSRAPGSRAQLVEPSAARGRGFTLIELLVVIAIIAVLVSILMPTLTQAKEHARRAACMTNLHNQGIAFSTYQTDYNGKFARGWLNMPFHIRIVGNSLTRDDWYGAMKGYADTGEIFYCPSYLRHVPSNWRLGHTAPRDAWQDNDFVEMGYALYMAYYRPYIHWENGKGGWSPSHDRNVRPPQTVDEIGLADETFFTADVNFAGSSDPWSPWLMAHEGGTNRLYADGHASWHDESEMTMRIGCPAWYWAFHW